MALTNHVVKAGLVQGVEFVGIDTFIKQEVHHSFAVTRVLDQGSMEKSCLLPLVIDELCHVQVVVLDFLLDLGHTTLLHFLEKVFGNFRSSWLV